MPVLKSVVHPASGDFRWLLVLGRQRDVLMVCIVCGDVDGWRWELMWVETRSRFILSHDAR